MSTFLTSDFHFFHHNICGPEGFCATRQHFKDVDEMNEAIITNFNNVVTDEDTVYHLGDMCMNAKPAKLFDVLSELKGTIYLVKGNHCNTRMLNYITNPSRNPVLKSTGDYKFHAIPMGTIIKQDGIQYYLTHYPQGLGQQRRKIRNFCGHIHDTAAREANVLNVGVDSPEIGDRPFGEPVLLEEAIALLDTKWTTWHECTSFGGTESLTVTSLDSTQIDTSKWVLFEDWFLFED